MDALWNYFDAIFCINVEYRKDRYDSSKCEFSKLKIPVQYHFVKRHHNGDQGCFESHREICRIALRNNWQRILIFEDDIKVSPNFTPNVAKNILKFLKAVKWRLFYFGCFPNNRYTNYQTKHNNIYMLRAVGAHAYALSLSQIKFISSLKWENKPYDSYLTQKYHYGYLPSLFMQKAVKSDIPRTINIVNNFPSLKYIGLYINERYTMHIGHPIQVSIIAMLIISIIIYTIILLRKHNKI